MSWLIGPGLGPEVGPFVDRILSRGDGSLLVDADALNALGGTSALERSGGTIITPHAGEFARLTGSQASYQGASSVAIDTGSTVVLKGGPTFVMGEEQWVITTGGPELATIGTGDILAGMVAAFWAAGMDGPIAARSAAFWHGRAAADLQATRTVTADLLADHIGLVTRRSHTPSR